MPQYKWSAKTKEGKKIDGEVRAISENDVLALLADQGLTPVAVKPVKATAEEGHPELHWYDTLPIKEKLFFIQGLMVMVRTGVPILNAIESLQKESKNKVVKNILTSMRENVMAGEPLNKVFTKYQRYFNPIYAAYIKGGEATGRLKDTLEILYAQLERDYELSSKVRSAIIYPSILILAVIATLSVIFGIVLPKLETLFTGSGIKPVPIAAALFGVSDFIHKFFWILLALTIIGIGVLIYMATRRNLRAKLLDFLSRIPKVGSVFQYIQLTRFCRSLSASLNAGLSFPESLTLTAQVLSGSYQRAVEDFEREIVAGKPLYALIANEPRLFPSTVAQIIAVGEKTGELPQVLNDLAVFYEKETETSTQNLIALVEPSLILFMGLVVGLITVAIIATIYGTIQRLR